MGITNSIIVRIIRPIKNYNVENRAHKVISKEKPTPAPRFPADQEALDNLLKENPKIIEEYSRKNIELDNRLRDVYVSSIDIKPIVPIQSSRENFLPLSRKIVQDHDYGCKLPDTIAEGCVTLKDAIKFINDHYTDKNTYTPSCIAAEYKLSEQDVENILQYYKTFELYLPKKKSATQKKITLPKWTKKMEEE